MTPPSPARARYARKSTDFIVIHCAATPADMDVGAREIDRWHRARGFRQIGYHYVIRRGGGVEPGRPLAERGAHARGVNDRSVGVCLVGGVARNGAPQANFAPQQYDALWRLLGDLAELYPEAEVLGHSDLPDVRKACPCFDVAAWLDGRAKRRAAKRDCGA